MKIEPTRDTPIRCRHRDGDPDCDCWPECQDCGETYNPEDGHDCDDRDELRATIAKLEAERDRLRKELERVRREPSPEEIDIHLDRVLRASGSALRNYSMASFLRDMRKAMREAMESPRAALTPTQEKTDV